MIRFVQHVFAAFLLIAPGAIATSAQAAAHVSKGGVASPLNREGAGAAVILQPVRRPHQAAVRGLRR